MGEQFSVKHKTGEEQKGLFWKCENPVGSVIVATGMQEHSSRYEEFALFLNKANYDVYVLDSFGQGLNAPKDEDLQVWPKDGFFKNVDGLAMSIDLAKKKSGGFSIIFGHSMGSFMVQSFLERYPDKADKVIICGSNGPAAGLYAAGSMMASLLTNKRNWKKPSKFLTNLAMGSYNKSIENPKTPCDWLSFDEDNVKKYIEDPKCGKTNTFGFWKGFLGGMNSLYKKRNLKRISKNEKILIIAGESDPVGNMSKGPVALEKMYRKLGVTDVTLTIYDHMRHEILKEKGKEKVFADILRFIKK